MGGNVPEDRGAILKAVFEMGAEAASVALSRWLGQTMLVKILEIDHVDISEAAGVLGPEDALLAACVMGLGGELSGTLILVFDDPSGLALSDLLLRRPPGTATAWGELEASAALETANIVGCAFLNSLLHHLPGLHEAPGIVPSPPVFRHEFAASLLEFAVMDQASVSDRILAIRSQFSNEQGALEWTLLLVPGSDSVDRILGSTHAG